MVEGFFKQLGWQVSPGPKKNHPVSELFDALVTFDLSAQAEQEVRVRNTASRIQEVKGSITTVQSRGRLSYEEAQRLRGRMIFAQLRLWCWKSRKAAIALGDVDPSSTDDGLWQLLQ